MITCKDCKFWKLKHSKDTYGGCPLLLGDKVSLIEDGQDCQRDGISVITHKTFGCNIGRLSNKMTGSKK